MIKFGPNLAIMLDQGPQKSKIQPRAADLSSNMIFSQQIIPKTLFHQKNLLVLMELAKNGQKSPKCSFRAPGHIVPKIFKIF